MADADYWFEQVRQALSHYSPELLRQVSASLFKPRNQWPDEELIERCLASLDNAAVIDRRLQDLDAASRRVVAFMAHSRQPRWRLGNLLELVAAVGHTEGARPIFALLESGFLYPYGLPIRTSTGPGTFKSFDGLIHSNPGFVFAPPQVMARALGSELGLPRLPAVQQLAGGIHEADGLEWPLRLAAVWQLVTDTPLRRTQQGGFFKRDLDRLQADPLLNAAPAETLVNSPDTGLLAVALAQIEGVIQDDQAELCAGVLPPAWETTGLPRTLASLWSALPLLNSWNPLDGWQDAPSPGNPYPSAYLLGLLLLAQLSGDSWARPAEVEQWLFEHHPYWQGSTSAAGQRDIGITTFLLGLAFQLRLVQAAKDPVAGTWLVRLSPLGRWLLGVAHLPAAGPAHTQTLLVQPNLEIIAYRQGLTPALVSRLSRFAHWKTLGAACTLQLEASAVYRGLESGLSFEAIMHLLETHGMRATPPAVRESLRTWADKRERISIYPSGTLFEFNSPEELNEALARGLPGVRLSDRLVVVPDEGAIDFRHFRLTGTRDYSLPAEKCVDVEDDGVTLAVDLTRSDLLLESELQRFAEKLDNPSSNGQRRYRLTPESVAGSRASGLSAKDLDEWFIQRVGQTISPAARLLLDGCQSPPPELRQQLVLHVANSELADGLCQWPGTSALIRERLGETALAVDAQDVETLRARLAALGVTVMPPLDGNQAAKS